MADQLTLPLAALAGDDLRLHPPTTPPARPTHPFDADALEYHFPTMVEAQFASAAELGLPLTKLSPDDRAFIDHVWVETRMRCLVVRRIRHHFRVQPSGEDHKDDNRGLVSPSLAVAKQGDCKLSIVLAGPPKLGNAWRRPTMEAIGSHTAVLTLDGMAGSHRVYLPWLLHVCTAGKIEPEMMLTTDAIDLLASKLRTPLYMQRHLTLALEVGYQTGEQPMSAGMVDTVLSPQLDDLEPTLPRHGDRSTDLVQQCDAKPTEITALFS